MKKFDTSKLSQPVDQLKSIPISTTKNKIDTNQKLLSGKKVIVTRADTKTGSAVAISLANEGADIAIVYPPEAEQNARITANHILETGQKVIFLPGDTMQENFCNIVAQQTINGLGAIDVLINNSGKLQITEELQNLEDLTTHQFQTTFLTDFYSMFWLTKAATPYMKSGGDIINIITDETIPAALDWTSTNGAIIAFTKNLSKILMKRGISINALVPNFKENFRSLDSGIPNEQFTNLIDCLDQVSSIAEIIKTSISLASQQSNHLNGKILVQ